MALQELVLPRTLGRDGNIVWTPQDILHLQDAVSRLQRYAVYRPITARVETTDATVTTLLTLTLEDGSAYQIVADVVARRTGGASGTAGDGASYRIIGTYRRVSAGSATLIGSVTSVHSAENQAGWDAALSVSGNDVLLRVTGATGNNLSWYGIVTVQRT